MKTIIFILSFTFIAFSGISQTTSKNDIPTCQNRFGLNLSYGLSKYYYNIINLVNPTSISFIDAAIIYNYKKNTFSLNPIYVFRNKDISSSGTSFGVGFNYQYYLTKSNHRFDISLMYETSYIKIKENDFSSGYNGTWHVNNFYNLIGPGARYIIFDNFYINSALLFGANVYRNIAEHVFPGDPAFIDDGKYYLAKSWYYKIGIGYNFIK